MCQSAVKGLPDCRSHYLIIGMHEEHADIGVHPQGPDTRGLRREPQTIGDQILKGTAL